MDNKQLDAEQLAEQIRTLEARAKNEARAELLAEITDVKFRQEGDEDTWQAGVDAVATFIRSNY